MSGIFLHTITKVSMVLEKKLECTCSAFLGTSCILSPNLRNPACELSLSVLVNDDMRDS